MLKEQMNGGDKSIKLTPGQHLLASAQSGSSYLPLLDSTALPAQCIEFVASSIRILTVQAASSPTELLTPPTSYLQVQSQP